MTRGLICSVLVAVLTAVALTTAHAARPADSSAPSPLLQRFLSLTDPVVVEYRAFRHLEAQSDRFDSNAWMDVWTDVDRTGAFHYRITGEGGSSYIRSRVFVPTLETEARMSSAESLERGALTLANYIFEDRGAERDGLAWLTLKPRRKEVVLVEGSIFLNPDDGDLVKVEGKLAKTPSFWTRRVEIVRHFRRLAGIRMPVSTESIATVLLVGRATFRMTYDYETVNGQRVASPQQISSR